MQRIKELWKTRNGKIGITAGSLLFICFCCFVFAALNPEPAEPALSQDAIRQTAEAQAWQAVTQTAQAIPTSTPKPPTVYLTLNVQLVGSELQISGETDLPNNTWLSYEINHEDYITDIQSPVESLFTDGVIQVNNNQYFLNIDISNWKNGNIEIWLAFQTIVGTDIKQPQEIIEIFGELGENLIGDNVSESGSMRRVELTKTTEWRESSIATIAPEILTQQAQATQAAELAEYLPMDPRELVTYANNHMGEKIVVTGKIFNINSDTEFQMFVGDNSDAVYVLMGEPFTGIYEDDVIKLYAIIFGENCGENAFGAKVCQPLLVGAFFEKQ